jgi:hypothetical protein
MNVMMQIHQHTCSEAKPQDSESGLLLLPASYYYITHYTIHHVDTTITELHYYK